MRGEINAKILGICSKECIQRTIVFAGQDDTGEFNSSDRIPKG